MDARARSKAVEALPVHPMSQIPGAAKRSAKRPTAREVDSSAAQPAWHNICGPLRLDLRPREASQQLIPPDETELDLTATPDVTPKATVLTLQH
jgi:hypothetical protein